MQMPKMAKMRRFLCVTIKFAHIDNSQTWCYNVIWLDKANPFPAAKKCGGESLKKVLIGLTNQVTYVTLVLQTENLWGSSSAAMQRGKPTISTVSVWFVLNHETHVSSKQKLYIGSFYILMIHRVLLINLFGIAAADFLLPGPEKF